MSRLPTRNQVEGVLRALSEATGDDHGGNFEEPWCEPDRRIETGEGARHRGLPPHGRRMTMKAVLESLREHHEQGRAHVRKIRQRLRQASAQTEKASVCWLD